MRIPRYNILRSHPVQVADIDDLHPAPPQSTMPQPDASHLLKPGFSLFRPGQQLDRTPVTLDGSLNRGVLSSPILISSSNPDKVWESLSAVTLDPAKLARNGLFPNTSKNPATAAFDMLRTRLLQAMETRGWRRIAITSPTHGCGKSFLAANLALSLARKPNARAVLMDMELRSPGLANLLGVAATGPISDFLSGDQPLESHLLRAGKNLALCLNASPVADTAALLHTTMLPDLLDAITDHLDPDIILFDLPPALGGDDVLAMLAHVDAVLLVADATQTSPEDIRACERLFESRCPLMGVVLNRARDAAAGRYSYGKA